MRIESVTTSLFSLQFRRAEMGISIPEFLRIWLSVLHLPYLALPVFVVACFLFLFFFFLVLFPPIGIDKKVLFVCCLFYPPKKHPDPKL